MPNRMLRDWTKSDKIEKVSIHAERFFTRLIMKVDDHGCFYADTRILKADLFPLLLDQVREADLTRWMAECQKAGLIVLYEEANKKYLQITDFNQRLRQKVQRFPFPKICQPDADNSPPEVEEEVEENRSGSVPPHDLSNSNLYRQPNIPLLDTVKMVFKQNGGTDEMAEKFFEINNGTGWFYKSSPITNFQNFVPGYIRAWNKNSNKDNPGRSKEQTEFEQLMAKHKKNQGITQ